MKPIVFAALLVLGGLIPSLRAEGCSNATFVGNYIYSGEGSVVVEGVAQPFVFVGRLTADGNGKFTGGSTSSLNGVITRLTYEASYSINADCTQTYEGIDSLGRTFYGVTIFLESGKRFRGMRTVNGQTIVFSGERDPASLE
jgi:hypothetical protein